MKTYFCNIDVTLDVIGGKWKILILYFLLKGPKRTSELKRLMNNVTQKVLVQALKELQTDGLVTRKSYNQVPPKVEYSLTELGVSLESTLSSLCHWGQFYVEETYAEGEVRILHAD